MSLRKLLKDSRITEIVRNLQKERVNILVCGLLDTGKSALINSMTGREDSDSQDIDFNDPFLPRTRNVKKFEFNDIPGCSITFYDTPGLQCGGSDSEARDRGYLDEMPNDFDLVIFCSDMTISRWTNQHIQITRDLTERFGDQFWKKCVCVLTKANEITIPPKKRKDSPQSYFRQRYENNVMVFRKQLSEQTGSTDIASDIPVIAAGYMEECSNLWYVSSGTPLGDSMVNFLPVLWATCLEKLVDMETGKSKSKPENMSSSNAELEQQPENKPTPESESKQPENKPTPESESEQPENKPTPESESEQPENKPTPESESEQPENKPTTKSESEQPENKPTPESESEQPENKPTPESESEQPENTPTPESESEQPENKPTPESESEQPENKPTPKSESEQPEIQPSLEPQQQGNQPKSNEQPDNKPISTTEQLENQLLPKVEPEVAENQPLLIELRDREILNPPKYYKVSTTEKSSRKGTMRQQPAATCCCTVL